MKWIELKISFIIGKEMHLEDDSPNIRKTFHAVALLPATLDTYIFLCARDWRKWSTFMAAITHYNNNSDDDSARKYLEYCIVIIH